MIWSLILRDIVSSCMWLHHWVPLLLFAVVHGRPYLVQGRGAIATTSAASAVRLLLTRSKQ